MSDAYWRNRLNRFRNDGSCERELLQALAATAHLREALGGTHETDLLKRDGTPLNDYGKLSAPVERVAALIDRAVKFQEAATGTKSGLLADWGCITEALRTARKLCPSPP